MVGVEILNQSVIELGKIMLQTQTIQNKFPLIRV